MSTIPTRLTTSGNSKAVRLPKTLLKLSQLGDAVELEARPGEIIIRSAKSPRAGWSEQIDRVLAADPNAPAPDSDLDVWHDTVNDGLNDIPWDGPTYEEWIKHGKR